MLLLLFMTSISNNILLLFFLFLGILCGFWDQIQVLCMLRGCHIPWPTIRSSSMLPIIATVTGIITIDRACPGSFFISPDHLSSLLPLNRKKKKKALKVICGRLGRRSINAHPSPLPPQENWHLFLRLVLDNKIFLLWCGSWAWNSWPLLYTLCYLHEKRKSWAACKSQKSLPEMPRNPTSHLCVILP